MLQTPREQAQHHFSAGRMRRWVGFLGTQLDSKMTPGGQPLQSWLRLAWVHELEPYRTINSSFIAAPGFDFIINGALAARETARVDVGFNFGATKNVGLFANFDGEFSAKGKCAERQRRSQGGVVTRKRAGWMLRDGILRPWQASRSKNFPAIPSGIDQTVSRFRAN
jgi:hypothetical protein